jgi:hypothetical protein
MKTKPAVRRAATGIGLATTLFLLSACNLEQVEIGNWNTLLTPRTGACPVLQWQFVVNPQRSIGGYLSPFQGNRIATLSGTLNPDDTFRMTATPLDGNRTATIITGRFNQQLTTMTIAGDVAGPACDGQTLKLRNVYYYGPYNGGGGGH